MPLPSESTLARRGISELRELPDAKQSRVFAARFEQRDVVVKFTDADLADRRALGERMRVVEELSSRDDMVIGPLRLDGELVHDVDGWLMILLPLVRGARLDLTVAADARSMGEALAHLHTVMAELPDVDLGPVAPLSKSPAFADWQLLHGDFSERNLIGTVDGLRILDFDDCGYGPTDYDIANSLYMVLFDADVNGRPERYEAFRDPFLDGYAGAAHRALDNAAIEAMIARRIEVLGEWLDDLSAAPIGVRTASTEWHETLRSFVRRRRR